MRFEPPLQEKNCNCETTGVRIFATPHHHYQCHV